MYLRLFLAALAAAFLFTANPPAMGPSTAWAEAATKAKVKKPPSPKQLAARQRMKECGAEWRELKKAKKTEGKTWRSFLKECRAKK